jgi:hypothetical protein
MNVIQLHYKTQQGLMLHTLILTCNSPKSLFVASSFLDFAIIRLLLLSSLFSTPDTISAYHKLQTTHITNCYMNNAFQTLTPE